MTGPKLLNPAWRFWHRMHATSRDGHQGLDPSRPNVYDLWILKGIKP